MYSNMNIDYNIVAVNKDAISAIESSIERYATGTDQGLDLVVADVVIGKYMSVVYTGMSFNLGSCHGLVMPRSSISKEGLMLANTIGLIDSDYRGEIILKFIAAGSYVRRDYAEVFRSLKVGNRVAQIVFYNEPKAVLHRFHAADYDWYADSERGDKGFGSTGE